MKHLLFLSIILLIFTACTETIDKEIDLETFAKDLKEIKSEYSNIYDSTDFAAIGFAAGMGKLMGAGNGMDGTTYRQMLDELKSDREKRVREQAAKAAKYEKDLEDWKKYQNELNNTIQFKIENKDFSTDRYGINEHLKFSYSLQNNSDKEIKAIKGGFEVYDTFGKSIGRYGIENENPIVIQETVKDEIYYTYNSYNQDNVKVKQLPLSNLKYEWFTTMVIFSDGSILEAKEEPKMM